MFLFDGGSAGEHGSGGWNKTYSPLTNHNALKQRRTIGNVSDSQNRSPNKLRW